VAEWKKMDFSEAVVGGRRLRVINVEKSLRRSI